MRLLIFKLSHSKLLMLEKKGVGKKWEQWAHSFIVPNCVSSTARLNGNKIIYISDGVRFHSCLEHATV